MLMVKMTTNEHLPSIANAAPNWNWEEGRPARQTTDEEPPTGTTRKASLKTMTLGRDASGGSTCIRHCVYPSQATDAADDAPLGAGAAESCKLWSARAHSRYQ